MRDASSSTKLTFYMSLTTRVLGGFQPLLSTASPFTHPFELSFKASESVELLISPCGELFLVKIS